MLTVAIPQMGPARNNVFVALNISLKYLFCLLQKATASMWSQNCLNQNVKPRRLAMQTVKRLIYPTINMNSPCCSNSSRSRGEIKEALG